MLPCDNVTMVTLSHGSMLPRLLQVLSAIRPNFDICEIYMANEFKEANNAETQRAFYQAVGADLVAAHQAKW